LILLTAKPTVEHEIESIEGGADDYISKPFGVLELVARVKANLRKRNKTSGENIVYKDIVIDYSKHQITVNDTQIKTTLKEYNLLCLLCANAEKVQERESIFNEVWGESFIGETRTLDIHIKELRKKLTLAQSAATIQTIRGVGYTLQ
jgi:two-component system alkaline phosphatase synthesis response regulator PhoP